MILCSFTDAIGRVRVGKRVWNFEFSERFGPLLLDARGEVNKSQRMGPKFWAAFEEWHAKYLSEKEASS